jgi:hypothetical protein
MQEHSGDAPDLENMVDESGAAGAGKTRKTRGLLLFTVDFSLG